MKMKILRCVSWFALAVPSVLPLHAGEPIIPPSLSKIWPVGMERGSTATFTLDGRNLSGAKAVIFDAPGITAKVTQITDLPEEAASGKVFHRSRGAAGQKAVRFAGNHCGQRRSAGCLPFPCADAAGHNQHGSPGHWIAPRDEEKRKARRHGAVTTGGVACDHGGHDCSARRQ